jgi:hypothetical protein
MNIVNYINDKNEYVNSLINESKKDLFMIDKLLELKRSSDLPTYIKVQNKLNKEQIGGAAKLEIKRYSFDTFTLTKDQLSFTIGKKLEITTPVNFKFTPQDVDKFKLYIDPATNQPKKADELINVLITYSDGSTVENIEILGPLTGNKKVEEILPTQLKSNEELRLKLFTSIIYLESQQKYVEKFNTLVTKVTAVSDNLIQIKENLKTKHATSLSSFTADYNKKLGEYLTQFEKTLGKNATEYNSMVKQLDELDNIAKHIDLSIAPK